MIRIFIFFCFIILLSCGKEERPASILAPEEMVASITAFYLMEAKIVSMPYGRDSSLKISEYFETKTLEKLGITDSVFQNSFNYYLDRPQELEEIYSIVIDSLNLWEQRSNNQTNEE